MVANQAGSYWPKMLQYVLNVVANQSGSYWPKMLQYVLVWLQIKPVVIGLKCYSIY